MIFNSKEKARRMFELSDLKFFNEIAAPDTVIVSQRQIIESFLPAQLFYRKHVYTYENKPLECTFTVFHEVLQKAKEDKFKYNSVVLFNPYVRLGQIKLLSPYVDKVFVATNFYSHYQEYKAICHKLPSNVYVYHHNNIGLVHLMNYVYNKVDDTDKDLVSLMYQAKNKNNYSPGRVILKEKTYSHHQFYDDYPQWDKIVKEIFALEEDSDDRSRSMLISVMDKIMLDQNKSSITMAYANMDSENPINYEWYINNYQNKIKTSCLLDGLVLFEYYRDHIQYEITRFNKDIDLLDKYSRYEPIGNPGKVIVYRPNTQFHKGVFLKA